jgi:CBS-domain-containing membrane protein
MIRRLVTLGAVALGLVVAAVAGVTAYQSLHAPLPPSGNSALTPVNCSPGPCADVQGYTLWLSEVSVNGDLVSMQVKFQNSSPSTHASPEDLQLIDVSRHASGLVTDAPGCTTWPRHDFNNGATFGPIDVCFRISNAARPFILRWSPDLGLFCCEQDINLT